jgi:hypothetical protein
MGRDHADAAHPFADGRNVLWELEGFGSDDWLHSSRSLDREQYLRVRHLFEAVLGEDSWMMAGSYPVPPGLRQPLEGLLGPLGFEADQDYFLGARQNLPEGRSWRPGPGGVMPPGPIPPPFWPGVNDVVWSGGSSASATRSGCRSVPGAVPDRPPPGWGRWRRRRAGAAVCAGRSGAVRRGRGR